MTGAATEAFYDDAYFGSHYGQFLDDPAYYDLKGKFWKKAIQSLWPVPEDALVLDYGCGLGQVTAAFSRCHYYDIAEFTRDFLRRRGRQVYSSVAEIPKGHFDVVISSHSLEHSPDPFEQLQLQARCARTRGTLILILPIEREFGRRLELDKDNHLFAWTFQTASNLLRAAGWQPCRQEFIYDSLGLRRFGRTFKGERAVNLAWRLGRITGSFRCMFLAAQKTVPLDA